MASNRLHFSCMYDFFFFLTVRPVLSGAIEVNCSEPTQPALLKALLPVFNMSAIRPVLNMSTCTNVSTYFTLYGILGVVSALDGTNAWTQCASVLHAVHKHLEPLLLSLKTVCILHVFQDEKAQLLLTYLWMHYVKN